MDPGLAEAEVDRPLLSDDHLDEAVSNAAEVKAIKKGPEKMEASDDSSGYESDLTLLNNDGNDNVISGKPGVCV